MEYKILSKIKTPADIKGLSKKGLAMLQIELRDIIIQTVSKNGGHLASNLGVVELTLALHLVFDMPKDDIVFDVSHQTYAHKLLTGRYEDFNTIRTYGGLSGYANIRESVYDSFGAGHASTSISAAVGLRLAKDLNKESGEVVCVIGDGALTGGMAFEALNYIGHVHKKLIIVINDNERSISENVGALSGVLDSLRISKKYRGLKRSLRNEIPKIPLVGGAVKTAISKAKSMVKQAFVGGMFFEELGLTYIGIIDGHDLPQMIESFNLAKSVDGPIVIHVVTEKGRGYEKALKDPGKYHGVGAFSIEDGLSKGESKPESFSEVFGNKLVKMAEKDADICAITPAMAIGSQLCSFKNTYSERFFDVGIAEEHAMTMAAGLAKGGAKPYFAIYSTFLQRAYDQLIHDVCLQNLPVRICIDRAGLVGDDGPTHHGVFDMPMLMSTPNIEILSPTTKGELEYCLDYSLDIDSPLAIRYPRGIAPVIETGETVSLLPVASSGAGDIAILSFGTLCLEALKSATSLEETGYRIKFIKLIRLKPLNADYIADMLRGAKLVVTVEDSLIIGGFGAHIQSIINDFDLGAKHLSLGYPDSFVPHGKIDKLNEVLGLDAAGIEKSISKSARTLGINPIERGI